MGRGWQDYVNDICVFYCFADVRSHFCKFAKSMRSIFASIEINAAALFDDFHMLGCTIVQGNGEPHQSEVGGHGLAPMTCADYCVFPCRFHPCASFQKIISISRKLKGYSKTGVRSPSGARTPVFEPLLVVS
jgi:hypothetical protein